MTKDLTIGPIVMAASAESCETSHIAIEAAVPKAVVQAVDSDSDFD